MTFITSVQRDRFMRYDDVFSNSASGTTEQNIISQRISRLDPPFKSLSLLPNLDVSTTSQHPIYHWCHTFNGIVTHKKRRHCATYSGGQLIGLNLEGSHMHARPKKDKGTTQHSRSIRKTATKNILQSLVPAASMIWKTPPITWSRLGSDRLLEDAISRSSWVEAGSFPNDI